MHHCQTQNQKIFCGGASPDPSPTREGDTPSQTPPSYLFPHNTRMWWTDRQMDRHRATAKMNEELAFRRKRMQWYYIQMRQIFWLVMTLNVECETCQRLWSKGLKALYKSDYYYYYYYYYFYYSQFQCLLTSVVQCVICLDKMSGFLWQWEHCERWGKAIVVSVIQDQRLTGRPSVVGTFLQTD